MPTTMWDMARPRAVSRNIGEARPVNNSNNTGYSYSIKGGPAASRPPREFIDSQYSETAPPVRPPPRNPRRNIFHNAEHSEPLIYPQSSAPNMADFSRSRTTMASHRQQDRVGTISPPSSPEPEYTTRRPADRSQKWQTERDVSPLDEDRRGMPLARGPSRNVSRELPDSQQTADSPQARSNIPQMRRMRRKQSDAALREAQSRERLGANKPGTQQGEVRYDAMTGEFSAAGRPPAVKPADYAHGLGITSASPSPTQQRSPSAVMTSFGNRVRRMAQTGRGDRKSESAEKDTDPAARAFSSSRPGWRGASGRTALVEPVHTTLEVAPLNIPAKNNKRIITPTSTASPTSNIPPLGRSLRGQTPPVSPHGAETGPGSRPRETGRKVLPPFQVASPVEPKQNVDGPSYPSHPSPPLSDSVESAPAHAHHAHQESVSSVYSQVSEPRATLAHIPNPHNLMPNDPWVQPPSRFSVTTYATSAANTPRESLDDFDHNRPPVPETPQQYRESPQPAQHPVMDRRRPEPTENENIHPSLTSSPIHISLRTQDHYMSSPFSSPAPPPSSAALQRKAAATGTDSNHHPIPIRSRINRPDSVASDMNKTLPTPPPETSARDRVTMINAQLSSLGNRRININRSIKQMTELMPTDSIMDSADVVYKREMEKRKVEALRLELTEVQKEEYELGLKLHRAYKRMDRDADYEPTTLWVRRVTG